MFQLFCICIRPSEVVQMHSKASVSAKYKEGGIAVYKNPNSVFATEKHGKGKLKLLFASNSMGTSAGAGNKGVWIGDVAWNGSKESPVFLLPLLQYGNDDKGEFVSLAFIVDTSSKADDVNMVIEWDAKGEKGLHVAYATNSKPLEPGDRLYSAAVPGGAMAKGSKRKRALES